MSALLEVAGLVKHFPAGRAGLLVADAAGVPASALPPPDEQGWCVCSGPEGGFDPADLAALGNYRTLWLGDHVLRAETAALAAVAVLASTTSRAQQTSI